MAEILGYNMPDDLYYQVDHSWARVEGDGTITIGMNEFFAKEAGDIVYVDMPFEDDEITAGETCGKLQSSKWIGKMIAPVSGTVVATNEELESNAGLINSDPYGEGWVVKVKPGDALQDDLARLMRPGAPALEEYMRKEKARAEVEGEKDRH